MSNGPPSEIPRTLGRWDLVLLKIVAIVNINNVPPVAVYGWTSLVLWVLAFLTFFVPEAIAVLVLARRYPGEGGIYLWTRREFGNAHGFLSGWCYWTNNLFYVPVLLIYMTGIFAFAGGEARAADLVNQKLFVAAVSFGWLALIAVANIRGLAVGKWIQNIGGVGAFLSVALVLAAAGAARAAGVGAHPTRATHFSWEMTTSFAVMCNALVGIELASTMGDEIRNPRRDLGPAIAIAGMVSIVSYLLVTGVQEARHQRRKHAGDVPHRPPPRDADRDRRLQPDARFGGRSDPGAHDADAAQARPARARPAARRSRRFVDDNVPDLSSARSAISSPAS